MQSSNVRVYVLFMYVIMSTNIFHFMPHHIHVTFPIIPKAFAHVLESQ